MASFLNSTPELRGQIQYLRALYQKKSSLAYNISQLKIKLTHRQTNTDYKDLRLAQTNSKVLSKKLEELESTYRTIKSEEFIPISKESQENLKNIVDESLSSFCKIEGILEDAKNSENYLNLLKEKFNHMKDEFERKKVRFGLNEKYLVGNSESRDMMSELNEDLREMSEKLASYSEENERLSAKKSMITKSHRKSVEKIKIYHQLSDNAMRLRSKLLFRKELRNSISNAELELEYHFQRVQKEEDRLTELEQESQETTKYLSRYESELRKLDEYIVKLENKLDVMYREREDLSHHPKSVSLGSENKEMADESITVSLTSLLTGFHQMRKDKDTLIAENNILKKKLLGLFSSKD